MSVVTVHLRVARDRSARNSNFRVDASTKPRAGALTDAQGHELWTVRATLELTIPDEMLRAPAGPTIAVQLTADDLKRIEPEITEPEGLDSDVLDGEEQA